LYQQIWDLQGIVCNLKDLLVSQQTVGQQTQTSLSKVIETVEVIAKQPAGEPIEKEITPFRKTQPSESRAMKIFAAGKEAEEAAKSK
jgi:hypothetical protein